MKRDNRITVYHGSFCKATEPNLSFAKPGKDFGKGFYLTTDLGQATKFARIQSLRHQSERGYVSQFSFHEKELKIYQFNSTSEDWLNCVVGNRDRNYSDLALSWKDYDVIIGKIADDDTSLVINAYMMGVYGAVGSKEAMETAIKNLKPEKLKNQICIKTEKAIKCLEYVGCKEVLI